MKCNKCNNLIPDNSTVCPFCGAPVDNTTPVSSAPVDVVPTTPVTPVMPQDQNMHVAAQSSAEPKPTPMPEPNPVPHVTPMSEPPVAKDMPSPVIPGGVTNPTPVAPVTPVSQATPATPVSPVAEPPVSVPTPTPVSAPVSTPAPTPVTPVAAPTPPSSEPLPTASPASPTVPPVVETPSVVDGGKIASAAPVIEKKKGKTGLIIAIVIILVAIIGVVVGIYFYEFKSANKRVDIMVNYLTKLVNNYTYTTNASGTYSLSGNVSANGATIGASVSGLYAYDMDKKVLNYTLKLDDSNIEYSGTTVSLKDITAQLYLNDGKMYLGIPDFFDKLIYADVPNYDEIFEQANTDINLPLIVSSVRSAVKNMIVAPNYEQKISDVTINGKTSKANVISFKLTADNQKKMATIFYNSIMNNSALLTELEKITGKTPDETKNSLQSSLDELTFEDSSWTMEICTKLIGEDFLGIKIHEDNKEIEIYPVNNGVKMVAREDNKEIFNIEIANTNTRTATTKDTDLTIKFDYDYEDTKLNMSVNAKVSEDLTPKVDEVNTKNSVDANTMTEQDMMTIVNNMRSHESLGPIIDYIMTLVDQGSSDDNTDITTE